MLYRQWHGPSRLPAYRRQNSRTPAVTQEFFLKINHSLFMAEVSNFTYPGQTQIPAPVAQRNQHFYSKTRQTRAPLTYGSDSGDNTLPGNMKWQHWFYKMGFLFYITKRTILFTKTRTPLTYGRDCGGGTLPRSELAKPMYLDFLGTGM
jgi:hypothetical protein